MNVIYIYYNKHTNKDKNKNKHKKYSWFGGMHLYSCTFTLSTGETEARGSLLAEDQPGKQRASV